MCILFIIGEGSKQIGRRVLSWTKLPLVTPCDSFEATAVHGQLGAEALSKKAGLASTICNRKRYTTKLSKSVLVWFLKLVFNKIYPQSCSVSIALLQLWTSELHPLPLFFFFFLFSQPSLGSYHF